jgi:hypothetical protein
VYVLRPGANPRRFCSTLFKGGVMKNEIDTLRPPPIDDRQPVIS